jgi:hypothetical protein
MNKIVSMFQMKMQTLLGVELEDICALVWQRTFLHFDCVLSLSRRVSLKLMEEKFSIQAVTWILLAAFTYVNNKNH